MDSHKNRTMKAAGLAVGLHSRPKAGEKLSRIRQRQKLIDSCITALYLHGPSRTTIDKVVSIAEMSPGIVNFYFETKAALLVAALEHLAEEFEERVQLPLAALRAVPGQALPRLIELYLDPDIASPRKVSVWYAFWGEASSRREYQEICGKRDLAFADLVRDLISGLICEQGAGHLDADAVALGLIGALEMCWQDIAFRDEADVDRRTAIRRCRAYLDSLFPGYFVGGKLAVGVGLNATIMPRMPPLAPVEFNVQTAGAMLVAAELGLAGIPAFVLQQDWLGYQILARPIGTDPMRVAVSFSPNGTLTYAKEAVFDWLALIIPEQLHEQRRCFIVPKAVVDRLQSAKRRGGAIPHRTLVQYENNYKLSL